MKFNLQLSKQDLKKTVGLFLFLNFFNGFSQTNSRLTAFAGETIFNNQNEMIYLSLREPLTANASEVTDLIDQIVFSNAHQKVILLKAENDQLGFTHLRFLINYDNIPVANKMIIAHTGEGKLRSLNGDLAAISKPVNSYIINESAALESALKKVNAKIYKWQLKSEEKNMQTALGKPDFSFYPKGEKFILQSKGNYYFTYRFKIYAHEPLSHSYVYVDASNGKILEEQNLICNTDVPGSAQTFYSGTQTITCDQNGPVFSLRETARGQGIETYSYSNIYSPIDFTNTSSVWTGTLEQTARDAHWASEKTYDYYWNVHGRNSLDNAGCKIMSYVQTDPGLSNAFWDGFRMIYGAGDGVTYNSFTAPDVCAHELTHGLVANSCGLVLFGEANALNEGFADIFGTSVERYVYPGTWDWKFAGQVTMNGNGFRNMQNPNLLNQPDTYMGTYWDGGGEPHINDGPCIHWFYVLANGESGVNDLSNSYNVTSIGYSDAERIAFRALTCYFTPTTDYANARILTILAARDLFGGCSNQLIQTTNAWYAVGVGPQYSAGAVLPAFTSNASNTSCVLPTNVSFINTSTNAASYYWDFGDGATSTSTNPVHSYTSNGTYNVKLKAFGCLLDADSLTQIACINISAPAPPITNGTMICSGTNATLTASGGGMINWYASPGSTAVIATGSVFSTPIVTATTNYYVSNSFSNTPVYVGIDSYTAVGTSGGYYNGNAGLIFDVTQPAILKSVVIYANAPGIKTVELRNYSLLNSTTVNLSAGANTVVLNYSLMPGTNYRLYANSNGPAIFKTYSGVSYPYTINNILQITGPYMNTNIFYDWFYNWEVQKMDCSSQRVPATASVFPSFSLSASASDPTVCVNGADVVLTGSPTGGVFSGAGVSGSIFTPTLSIGTHSINYSYTGNNGCSESINFPIEIVSCAGIQSNLNLLKNISLLPNPAHDLLTIKNAANFVLTIFDASGRNIYSRMLLQNDEYINTDILAPGIYFVSLTNESVFSSKHVKLIIE